MNSVKIEDKKDIIKENNKLNVKEKVLEKNIKIEKEDKGTLNNSTDKNKNDMKNSHNKTIQASDENEMNDVNKNSNILFLLI